MRKLTFTVMLILANLIVFGIATVGVHITRLHQQLDLYDRRLAQLKGDIQMNNEMFWQLWLEMRNITDYEE